ncbi:MAG TPA: ATP-binding cassette domain-containing protein [Planctomycetota bacterium]|nr:ATP-binding cassette domain-containing protein [Planctomycetota bacterium]
MPALFDVADFRVRRDDGWSIAVPKLRLHRGETAALYGPSGGGKTTALQAMFGLLRRRGWTTEGTVSLDGTSVLRCPALEHERLLRHAMAFLIQDAHAALDPLQAVARQIRQATGCAAGDAPAALARLGVADAGALGRRLPHEISGGEAQRVLLAIAVLRAPALVVADEPTASLDGGNYGETMEHLRTLVRGGSALLLATHDHRVLRDLDAAVYSLRDGVFERGDPPDVSWPQRAAEDGAGAVPVLQAHAIHVSFAGRPVLCGLDFVLHRSEVVAIVGESGAGKTTLARVLAGHRAPDLGRVGRPDRRAAVQLVGQDALASFTPGRTLRDLLAEASAPRFDVAAAAAELQLPLGVLASPASCMSGGERRRAALLRAVAVRPDVLILDEPTASLDRTTATAVVQSLRQMQSSRGFGVVLITHDLELAHRIAHRVLTLQGGRLCE